MAEFILSYKQGIALDYLQDDHTSEVFYGGGAGSGKSRLGCYWHIKRRLKYPKTRGVIGRAKLGTLLESTFVTFLKVCELLQLKQNREFRFNQVKSKVLWANGSETILKDLFFYPSDPEFQSLGSTEYTDAFVDEAPEVTEKAIEILGSRLRYMLHDYGLKPKILMTGNPGDHWIKKKYVKDIKGDFVTLKHYQQRVLATLSDNPDKDFVRLYMEQLGKLNEYDKQRLLHGDWDAIPRTGFEFYPQFNISDHMKQVDYIPDLPIHFTFDVNEHPYMTLELVQIQELEDRVQVRFFDEFCYPHPFNSIRAVSTAAVTRYSDHNAGAYVYGDYTSKRQDSDLGQSYKHKYDIAFEVLRPLLSTGYDRVLPNANPILRRDLMRGCLDRSLPIEIIISDKCHQLKNDMIYLKEGPNGHKIKQKERNPITLVTYEKWGHATDAGEYFLSTAFPHYLNRKRVA